MYTADRGHLSGCVGVWRSPKRNGVAPSTGIKGYNKLYTFAKIGRTQLPVNKKIKINVKVLRGLFCFVLFCFSKFTKPCSNL